MFKFITEKPLWVNLLAALVLILLIIFITLQTLGWVTKHGQYLTVPSLVGKDNKAAIKILEDQGFDVVIRDSVYTDTLKKGTVIKQLPDGNSTVKVNRTVFLTVNRYVPPMIEMPKLEGLGLRFALDMLERSHLKLRDTIYKASFIKGAVIEQQFYGHQIMPGQKLQWGSAITLVIGAGLSEEQIKVPDLVGMRFSEAKALLDSNGILLGGTVPWNSVPITDTPNAFVVKQGPDYLNIDKTPAYMRSGQIMDLFISPVMINLKDTTAAGQ